LDIKQIENNTLKLNKVEFDLKSAINDTIDLHQDICEKKKLKIVLHFYEGDPKVFSDMNRNIQVLNNLISNSTKFSSNSTIHIVVVKRDDSCYIKIIDFGAGIKSEQ
jgi:two-component system, OmpR family, sensor histidine kinase BaeS